MESAESNLPKNVLFEQWEDISVSDLNKSKSMIECSLASIEPEVKCEFYDFIEYKHFGPDRRNKDQWGKD